MRLFVFSLLLLSFCTVVSSCPFKSHATNSGNPFYTCSTTQCGCDQYYCESTKKCISGRSQRCPVSSSSACSSEEKNCRLNTNFNMFQVTVGIASLGGPKRRKSNHKLHHMYVRYRGFTYEFGCNYFYAELDVSDPYYKYSRVKSKESSHGFSSCTRGEVVDWITRYKNSKPKYSLWTNNCQHFGNRLVKYLLGNCGRSSALSNQMNNYTTAVEALSKYRDYVIPQLCHSSNTTDCSVMCDENDGFVVDENYEFICNCKAEDVIDIFGGGQSIQKYGSVSILILMALISFFYQFNIV